MVRVGGGLIEIWARVSVMTTSRILNPYISIACVSSTETKVG